MLRGDVGHHEVASMERLVFITGRPISPHQALPEALALPEDFEKFLWVPLLENMLPSLGLPEAAMSEDLAAEKFECLADGKYSVMLADGTATHLRFREMDSRLYGECFGVWSELR